MSVLVVVGKNITFKKLSKGKWIIFGSLIAWGENAWGNSLTEPTYEYIHSHGVCRCPTQHLCIMAGGDRHADYVYVILP